MIGTPLLDEWLAHKISLCNPAEVIIYTNTPRQRAALTAQMIQDGSIEQLAGDDNWLHRSNPTDVARMEDRTFICTSEPNKAGATNNWICADEAMSVMTDRFTGAFAGRKMYVIPYAMGPLDGPFTKYGIEVTDSPYVTLSMGIMTRVSPDVLSKIQTHTPSPVLGMHCTGELNPDDRWVCHFTETQEIWSFGSNYGGNALLGKKCFALRLASVMGFQEGWLAEHMLIMEITNPEGNTFALAAAFPSACGKTNLAMLNSQIPGWKVNVIGDDIAWIRLDDEGYLRAVNPEFGFFGVVPGTSESTNPMAMDVISHNTIFTNVAVDTEGTPWWEGKDEEPEGHELKDWRGMPQKYPNSSIRFAQPNSRFTSPLTNCKAISPKWNDPQGVRLDAILFGGRRATMMPLIVEATDWNHGVFLGASMASQTTAAAGGRVGVLRRDPMAMLPFCGYSMCRYFEHWINVGAKTVHTPRIFHVNWFRQDADGKYLWPGFSANLNVLQWITERLQGRVGGRPSAIGILPIVGDLDISILDVSPETMEILSEVDAEVWLEELKSIETFFASLGDDIPVELLDQIDTIRLSLTQTA